MFIFGWSKPGGNLAPSSSDSLLSRLTAMKIARNGNLIGGSRLQKTTRVCVDWVDALIIGQMLVVDTGVGLLPAVCRLRTSLPFMISTFLGLFLLRAAVFICLLADSRHTPALVHYQSWNEPKKCAIVPFLLVWKYPNSAHADAAPDRHVWRTVRYLVLARDNMDPPFKRTRRRQ
jgi:hypothetical protein